MIVVSIIDGKKYLLKKSKYYDNAKELAGLLFNEHVTMEYVKAVDGTYISTKHIITIKDS